MMTRLTHRRSSRPGPGWSWWPAGWLTALTLFAPLIAGCVDLLAQEPAALYVAVVLDDSGSMAERMRGNRRVRKITAAQEALLTVLEQLPASAQVGIALLNGRRAGSPWVVPLKTVDFDEARQAILRVGADGGTPLGEAMKVGADALLQARQRAHYGDFRLLLVTDGEATDPDLVERYLPEILARGLTVDVIGVDMPDDYSLATRVHSYRRADDPASLTRAVQEVFAETAGGSPDAGESDFEILQGIPPDVAAAALAALGEVGNEPIGESEASGDGLEIEPGFPAGPPPAAGSAPHPQPGRRERRWPTLLAVFFVLFVLQALGVVRRANRCRRQRRSR